MMISGKSKRSPQEPVADDHSFDEEGGG
jgi:hypothetical protein